MQTKKSDIYNIGNSQGFSVMEKFNLAEKITNTKISFEISARRKGDPTQLIADNKKIKDELNWSPKYSDLKTILMTAWKWEKYLSKSN